MRRGTINRHCGREDHSEKTVSPEHLLFRHRARSMSINLHISFETPLSKLLSSRLSLPATLKICTRADAFNISSFSLHKILCSQVVDKSCWRIARCTFFSCVTYDIIYKKISMSNKLFLDWTTNIFLLLYKRFFKNRKYIYIYNNFYRDNNYFLLSKINFYMMVTSFYMMVTIN